MHAYIIYFTCNVFDCDEQTHILFLTHTCLLRTYTRVLLCTYVFIITLHMHTLYYLHIYLIPFVSHTGEFEDHYVFLLLRAPQRFSPLGLVPQEAAYACCFGNFANKNSNSITY